MRSSVRAEVESLKATARQRLAAAQGELDLGLQDADFTSVVKLSAGGADG
jgi:hypothetical protein